MLKIKIALIASVAIIAIGGAFATSNQSFCQSQPQYYKYGNYYLPAGDYGEDYICVNAPGNCTYYLADPFNPSSFAPCRTGSFTWNYINK